MALPQHKTTLSILRSIIGTGAGSEARFSQKIGRSTSWLKKASCGQIRLTRDAAIAINYATGVSWKWLLEGDVNRPPVTMDGNPFTQEAYSLYHHKDHLEHNWEDRDFAEYEFTSCVYMLTQALYASISNNRGGLFSLHLSDFVDQMIKRFGKAEIHSIKFGKYMARGIYRELCRERSSQKSDSGLDAKLDAISSAKEQKPLKKQKPSKIKSSTPRKPKHSGRKSLGGR